MFIYNVYRGNLVLIQEGRIRALNEVGIRSGEYALYWMQYSVIAEFNHALEFAVRYANRLDRSLLVPEAYLNFWTDCHRIHMENQLPDKLDADCLDRPA